VTDKAGIRAVLLPLIRQAVDDPGAVLAALGVADSGPESLPGLRANAVLEVVTPFLGEPQPVAVLSVVRPSGEVQRWNSDKPHRCPECHAVAVDLERPSRWKVYECCMCHALFARWPLLARFLPKAGVRCSEHRVCEGCGKVRNDR